MIHYQKGKNLNFMKGYATLRKITRETYDRSGFVCMLCVHVHFVYPAGPLAQYPDLLLFPNWLILQAYKNGNCPAISVPQNGSGAQEAPNLLNQAKVVHFQPIEKLACGMPQ